MGLCLGPYGGPYMSLCVGPWDGPRGETVSYERGYPLLKLRCHESHRHLAPFPAVPARRLVIRGRMTRNLDRRVVAPDDVHPPARRLTPGQDLVTLWAVPRHGLLQEVDKRLQHTLRRHLHSIHDLPAILDDSRQHRRSVDHEARLAVESPGIAAAEDSLLQSEKGQQTTKAGSQQRLGWQELTATKRSTVALCPPPTSTA